MTAPRTPEETQALALERIVEALTDAWANFDSALLRGLQDDGYDEELLGEMNRLHQGIRAESAANPTPTMVWQAVTGGFPNFEWWRQFDYMEDGTSWEVPGTLRVKAEDPNDERKTITKSFTALDLLHAYKEMPNKTHCGGCALIGDPDACSSDLILQWAMYGEIVYG